MSKSERRHFRDAWNLLICKIPSRRIRRWALRALMESYKPGAFVGLNVQLMSPHKINISDRSVVNANCILDARGGRIQIAHDVDIGTQTHLWTLEHDPNDPCHLTKGGPVTIEDHVWIASRVTILPGVTIRRGAVIACGAVVTKDVAENSIVAGIPAKKIGTRENPLKYRLNYHPRFR